MSSTVTRRRVELTDGRVVIRRIIVETDNAPEQAETLSGSLPLAQTASDIERATAEPRRTRWRGAFRRHRS